MIESELFLLVILKTEFVHSNKDTPKNHLPSFTIFIGGEKEKFAFAYSIRTPESLEDGFSFIEKGYQYSFNLKATVFFSFKDTKSTCCYIFNEFFIVLRNNIVLFSRVFLPPPGIV